ncbi:AAR2 protein-domain-containing protein [Kalaharituber pfeilii]|nr:AAR2 protein-domain-containing protein [Kalaharituber pfeilii]
MPDINNKPAADSNASPPAPSTQPHFTSLILLSLPLSTFIGLDLFSFTTSSTPQTHPFHGIKLIPPAAGSTVVLKWDDERQRLVSGEEIEVEQREMVARDWVKWWYGCSLVEYRARGGAGVKEAGDPRVWRELTGEIGEGTLERILGGKAGRSLGLWRVEATASAPQDRDDDILVKIPLPKGADEGGEQDQTLNLLPIDLRRTFPQDATGRERTLAATDRTWYLGHLVETHLAPKSEDTNAVDIDTTASGTATISTGDKELLAELQLTFLHALTLSNFSCGEAWKRILALCFTCETRVLTHPEFYVRLMDVLLAQLGTGLSCFTAARSASSGNDGSGSGGDPGTRASSVDDEDENDAGAATYIPKFLAESSSSSNSTAATPNIPRLLRTFLRTLHRIQSDLPPPVGEHQKTHRQLEALLERFGQLERLVEDKLGWTVDTSKVVKRGMVQLEDGEMVELELAGLLGEEEEEEGEGPVVVEL